MKKLPVALSADVHLDEHTAFATLREGFNSRLLDGEAVVLYMAAYLAAAKGKTLIIAGDWFHSRKKISVNVLFISERCIRRCKEEYGVEIVAMVGNHDLSYDGNANSIKGQPFKQVISEAGIYEIDGWKVGAIPWTDKPKDVRKVLDQKADFYIGHFGVAGSKVGPSDFEIPGHIGVGDLSNSHGPIFLGHYHKPQEIAGVNARYLGSPLQISWGESGESKSFHVGVEKKGKFVSSPVLLDAFPRFVKLPAKDIKKARKNDFNEISATEDEVERARNVIAEVLPNASVAVQRDIAVKPPRVPMQQGVKSQMKTYMDYKPLPEGVSKDEALRAGLELLGL